MGGCVMLCIFIFSFSPLSPFFSFTAETVEDSWSRPISGWFVNCSSYYKYSAGNYPGQITEIISNSSNCCSEHLFLMETFRTGWLMWSCECVFFWLCFVSTACQETNREKIIFDKQIDYLPNSNQGAGTLLPSSQNSSYLSNPILRSIHFLQLLPMQCHRGDGDYHNWPELRHQLIIRPHGTQPFKHTHG